MSAVPVAPQALQDPDVESIEPSSLNPEREKRANLTPGLLTLSTWLRERRDEESNRSTSRVSRISRASRATVSGTGGLFQHPAIE